MSINILDYVISINIFVMLGMIIATTQHSLCGTGLDVCVCVVLALNTTFQTWQTYEYISAILYYYFLLPYPVYVVITF